MSKASHHPEVQERRYLDAIIRLFQQHFPKHPNVANDQSLRYLRQNLMQSIEYVGSAERLHELWSCVCADTTPRGFQTIAAFAGSRNLANYLLGGLKRDLLTRFSADRTEVRSAPSEHRLSAPVIDSGKEIEDDEEDSEGSVYEEYGNRKLNTDDPEHDADEVLYDPYGDPMIFDEDGERIPPPGFDPLAELDPEDNPYYDPDQVLYDADGDPIIFDDDGERIPPPGFDPYAELDAGDDPDYDPDWDNR
jgi:hypothetical protein